MVSPRFHCDQSRLKLALADRLPGNGQQQLATHLEHCDDCRTQLAALAAGRDWWDKAQSHLTPDLSGDFSGHLDSGVVNQPTADKPWLGFLVSCDDDRFLGRLGPYEVSEVIGSGGFGVVLKALDPALNRLVAIKVLSPQLANSGAARRRFAREAQAAAAVVHEHVVAIHSVAENDGLPYLVMPYIAGCSLQDRLDEHGPLEVKEVLRIGLQVAAGLAAAHAQGLVHRDIKPANILLENGVERVKITDFGLARAIDDASLTASGVVAGTPQYMAPEQARGEAVDHRSDLFSLGSVLYAACTGHSPFRAETFMAVWRRLCIDTPRPILETNPEVPDWLAEIIEKLHAKQPGDRFQSAAEVSDLLGRHLAHLQQPAVAPRPARLRSRRRGWPRRAAWAATAALAICLTAAVVWWWPAVNKVRNEVVPTGQQAASDGTRVADKAPAAQPDGTELRAAEWNRDIERANFDMYQLERHMSQPASTMSPSDKEWIVTLEAELEKLEREWETKP